MTKAVLGIIGGSGIYDLPGLQNVRDVTVASPWGEPSDAAALRRHRRTSRSCSCPATTRATGCRPPTSTTAPISMPEARRRHRPVSLSACGSFKEELPPGTFVLVDQFVDRTYHARELVLRQGLRRPCVDGASGSPAPAHHSPRRREAEGIAVARDGTYVCMEGPQFSTLAESLTYKGLGYSVIGMTNMPEAKLAREAEICYATVAMVTDFDCWHPDHDAVDGAGHHQGADGQRREGAAAGGAAGARFPARARAVSDRLRPRARHGASSPRRTRAIPTLLKKLDAVAGRVLKG